MPSESLLQIVGSRGDKQPRYAPIFTDRFFVGLWTNRNPLRSPLSTFYADGWHLGGTDALIAGVNIELSPRLTLCRRAGNIAFSTATIPLPPDTFYPFRLFGTSSIDTIVDTATNVYTLTPTTLTSIFTKSAGAGQSNFLGIGQTLYFGDGVEVEAWQNGVIRNWGISIGPFANAVGFDAAGAGADGGGPNPWTNPNNVTSNVSYATVTAGRADVSNQLNATDFGFSIPLGNTVTGIVITFRAAQPSNTVFGASVVAVLLKNGSPVGSSRTAMITSTPTIYTLGSVSDLWGSSFSANDVSQTAWGVSFYVSGTPPGSATGTFEINDVQAKIYGTGGPTVSLTTGTLSPTTGYEYVVAYGNSTSGQVSSATPPSALIKPVAQGVLIDLVASSDPQVNQIWVFRTADGGNTFLNIPTSPYPNTTQNVTDTAPDSELNILQQAPIDFSNNPPLPNSLDPVLYLGLVWVHAGNAVYFSRTPSAIVGISAESFPPANVFTFPEEVIRKVPINNGLLIFTTSNIYVILGNNTSTSILYSAPFLAGYGVLSWNAVFIDGSIIYFFTADHRMISLDPSSGVTDMGFPIGDQLASFNPANVYVAYVSQTSNDVALYLGDGSTGWFRCNPNQAPDGQITGPVWSPKANIVGGCGAIAAMETVPGTHQLMIGGTGDNLPVLVRDSTYTTFTDNGTAYAANFTIGSIVLAQPGQAAIMRFISVYSKRIGTSPLVSVLLGEISGTFESISAYVVADPPYLAPSNTIFNNRHYFKQTVGGNPPSPTICCHLQVLVDFGGTDTVQNEMLSMTINGAHTSER
jgi:hypothetical protein